MVVTEVLAIVLWSPTEAVSVRLQFSLLESSWVRCYHASQGHFPCVTGSLVLSCLRFLEEAPYLFLNVFHGSPTHFLSNFFLNNIYLLFNMCVCMYMGVCTCIYRGTLLCARFWGDVNKPLLTQDGELMTDQRNDASRVQFGDPMNFYLDTNRSILRGYLQEQGRLQTTCRTWSPP